MADDGEKESYFTTYMLPFEDGSIYAGITERQINARIVEHRRDGKKFHTPILSMQVLRTRSQAEEAEKLLIRGLSACGHVVTNKKGMPLAAETINAAQPNEVTATALVRQGQRYTKTRRLHEWTDYSRAMLNQCVAIILGWSPTVEDFAKLSDHISGGQPPKPPAIERWLSDGRRVLVRYMPVVRAILETAEPDLDLDWSAVNDNQILSRFYSINHYRNECQWINPDLEKTLASAHDYAMEALYQAGELVETPEGGWKMKSHGLTGGM